MRISKKKLVGFCLALMIMGAGINYPGLFALADFKGWYVGWLLSIPFLARYFKVSHALFILLLAVSVPSAFAFLDGAYASPKGLFTFGLFAVLLVYARALVWNLGHEAVMQAYATWGAVLAVAVLANEFVYIISPALSQALFGESEAVSFATRARGLFLEPSEAALYLTPPLVYYFLRGIRRGFLIVLLAMLTTFSGLTYISAVLAILLIVYLRTSMVNFVISALAACVVIWSAASSPQIIDRIDTIVSVAGGTELDFYSYNSSVATIIMNSLVARDSLFGTYFMGVGFGNFEHAFNEYAPNYFPMAYTGDGLFWNRNTGGSLMIRVTAELGAVGIAIVAYVMYKLAKAYYFTRSLSRDSVGRVVLQGYVISAIVMFVICLLRKDSLTNIHLFIFLVGALMLPRGQERIVDEARKQGTL